jgi:hypothetical protein
MTFEEVVQDALRVADDYEPSPDLFTKVQRSIDDDAAHRSRVRSTLAWITAGVLAGLAYLAVTAEFVDGAVSMSFRELEFLVTAVMVSIVLVLGPSIRRFGESYEGDAFRAGPETATNVLRLVNVAYYLIFGAYILMSLLLEPPGDILTLAGWIRLEMVRIAGLLLLMGVLHVALLVALPIAGMVFSANLRRLRLVDGLASTDEKLNAIDRAITVVAWVGAGLVVFQLLFGVINLVLLGLPG